MGRPPRGGDVTGRVLLGGAGVALAAYGGFLLLSRQDPARLVDVAVWLLAGVLMHDLVLAPMTILLARAGRCLLPRDARGPAALGLVVLGSLTLLAVPVLGRFGARPDNPTLLDRDYTAGWLAIAGLVLLGVLVGTLRARVRRPADGPGRGSGTSPTRREA